MVDTPLDAVAVRVLGSLIEKEITTPDNYPLSLNALVAACNQSSARDPVMELDEMSVSRSINDLRQRSLARGEQRSDSRVMRYRQLMSERMNLDAPELAVMAVLMLRGPQTAGEIKGRANRLFDFRDLNEVETTLEALIRRHPAPLVARLPRRPGQKDARYAHLLSGEVAAEAGVEAAPRASDVSRLDALEQAVNALRAELIDLRSQVDEFRREFQ
jgi:uncharacterized protein YceH (UPF0502 family)